MKTETKYTVSIDYRDSGNWLETGDPSESFDDLDEAKESADGAEGGDYGPGEYRAIVTDEDGDEVYRHEWRVDPEQDKFDAAKWLVEDEGEFSTEYYGIGEKGEYLHTIQNGGSRGAHSRQEGDGRWNEMADEVEEIELKELLKAIISNDGGDILDAAKKVADAHPSESLDDIILAVADEWDWSEEEKESVLDWIAKDDPTWGDKIKEKMASAEND